jgi:hypothetical protein
MATVIATEKRAMVTSVTEGPDSEVSLDNAPLGVPWEEKRFFFQRTRNGYDPDAIATQVCSAPTLCQCHLIVVLIRLAL